jgi:hypothetical protein
MHPCFLWHHVRFEDEQKFVHKEKKRRNQWLNGNGCGSKDQQVHAITSTANSLFLLSCTDYCRIWTVWLNCTSTFLCWRFAFCGRWFACTAHCGCPNHKTCTEGTTQITRSYSCPPSSSRCPCVARFLTPQFVHPIIMHSPCIPTCLCLIRPQGQAGCAYSHRSKKADV